MSDEVKTIDPAPPVPTPDPTPPTPVTPGIFTTEQWLQIERAIAKTVEEFIASKGNWKTLVLWAAAIIGGAGIVGLGGQATYQAVSTPNSLSAPNSAPKRDQFDDQLNAAWAKEKYADKNSQIRAFSLMFESVANNLVCKYRDANTPTQISWFYDKSDDVYQALAAHDTFWAQSVNIPLVYGVITTEMRTQWTWPTTDKLTPQTRDKLYTTSIRISESLKALKTVEPGPGPNPCPPVINTIAAHCTFVFDPTNDTATIVNDPGLLAYMKANNITPHTLRPTDASKYNGFTQAIINAGGVPCIVLQDANNLIIDQAKMINTTNVQTILQKHVKETK